MIVMDIEGLKFSSIPAIQNYDKSTLKAQSSFLKNGSKFVSQLSLSGSEKDIKPDPSRKFTDIIVISPGSRTLRFGLATDAQPHEAAHVIARKVREVCHPHNPDGAESNGLLYNPSQVPASAPKLHDGRSIFPRYDYTEDPADIINNFKSIVDNRLKNQKLGIVPNAQEQVNLSNSTSKAEILPDYNDPAETDWISDVDTDFVVGDKALKLEVLNSSANTGEQNGYKWKLFYPLRHGCLNVSMYHSMRSCIEDMVMIWKVLIETELNIPASEFPSYLVALVIPDIFNKQQVCDTTTALLSDLKFKAITFIQESAAATFAAAATSACIVNIGAQQTTVACVEDGVCFPDSRFNLKYGSDDITRFLFEVLKRSNIPYAEVDIDTNVSDWKVIEKVKEMYCTFNEIDLAVETAVFYIFSPHNPTMQYQMKYYYEFAISPLLLFYPNIIDFSSKLEALALEENWLDYSVEDDAETSFLTKQQLYLILKYNRAHPSFLPDGTQYKNLKCSDRKRRLSQRSIEDTNSKDKDCDVAVNSSTTRDLRDAHSSSLPKPGNTNTDNVEVDPSKDSQNKKQKLKSEQTSTPSVVKSPTRQFDTAFALDAYMRYRRGLDSLKKVSMPLDVAIAESIKSYVGYLSDTRSKDVESYTQKTLGSIILIGGGSSVKGLSSFLEERVTSIINSTLHNDIPERSRRDMPQNIQCRVLRSSREVDPSHYVWKGASVFGRLDSAADTWIGRQEWEIGGICKAFPKLAIPWY